MHLLPVVDQAGEGVSEIVLLKLGPLLRAARLHACFSSLHGSLSL